MYACMYVCVCVLFVGLHMKSYMCVKKNVVGANCFDIPMCSDARVRI